MVVTIVPAALKEIHEIAERTYPFECCGFLYGQVINNEVVINSISEVINDSEENKKVHYTIPPKAYMKAERHALDLQTSIIGVFHSHPDHPPKPSSRDLADALPELSYFITSVYQGEALASRSFRLSEARNFIEESIEITYHKK